MAKNDISDQRKLVFYLGLVLMIGGILTVVIAFGSLLAGCGERFLHGTHAPAGFIAFFIGMVMAALGRVLMGLGQRGAAGSGLLLDPKAAREDLKPWSKMTGGMLQDALEETDLARPRPEPQPPAPPPEADFDTALRKLHQLYQDGILSDEEYREQKQAILKKLSS